ncbi:calpain-A-like [Chironomus tepperi]|uniref:calpain-A-like n=1 Tax=Chironomus tepperi TaxID=113505 RepID=UPI00391FB2DD
MINRRYTFDGQPIYLLGERGSELHRQIKVQDFYALHQQYIKSGKLFEDPEFPATDKSLFYTRQPVIKSYKWLRPSEMSNNPKFFVDGFSRFDARQGELGNCWFLAAAANLTLNPKLFSRVVHHDNSFVKDYCGIFHFCFWRFGKWIDVVIDDRLPTLNGKLVFMHSPKQNEFWSALLEKAYAKLHGSYEALKNGLTNDALEDFTGGLTERYDLKKAPSNLYCILQRRVQRDSMMACSINNTNRVREEQTPEGLVRGHVYSITKVQYVDIVTPNTKGKIPLLRLRNPWGNHIEWNGQWSDRSPQWRYIPDHAKKQIGLTFEHDGEFWMSYADFLQYFDNLYICNLSPDSFEDDHNESHTVNKHWNINVFEGEWIPKITAGGCSNSMDTFHLNPQYVMKLDKSDDDDKCTVIISLMQKYRRMKRSQGLDFMQIGFEVYRISKADLVQKPLKKEFFKKNRAVAGTQEFVNIRSVFGRFELYPGHYLIVPSTFEPNLAGEFLIRVFSEGKNVFEENDEKVRLGDIDSRVKSHLLDVNSESPQRLTIEKLFANIAGSKNEIDWMDLKQMMDHSLRKELLNEATELTFTNNNDLSFTSNSIPSKSKKKSTKKSGSTCCFGRKSSSTDSYMRTTSKSKSDAYASAALIANESENQEFSKDMCRSMVAMMDVNRSGKLGLEEFKTLMCEIAKWRAVFKLYDRDRNNKLSTYELRDALNSAGYKLNCQVLSSLIYRYGSPDNTMSIDDFILCAVKVKTMIERFKEKDYLKTNVATFTMDEWVARALYS